MEQYNVVIIDDEKLCTKAIELDIGKHCPELEIVGIFNSPKIALEKIKSINPDIVFLDIEMPWMNGFEFLQVLSPLDFEVIFTTAYNEFAIQAFRANATDYLLKPIEVDLLKLATSKAIEKIKLQRQSEKIETLIREMTTMRKDGNLCIPTRDGFEFVPVSDIIYCQSDDNYCMIKTIHGESKLVSKTLKDIEAQLDDKQFLRIHQSYLINLDYVKSYSRSDGGRITLSDGKTLPVSRLKKDRVIERLKG